MPTNMVWSARYAPQAISLVPAAIGDNIIVAGVAGQVIRVYRILVVAGAATNIIFKDGAGNNLTGALPLLANGSVTLDFSGQMLKFGGEPWFFTALGNSFIINSSAAVNLTGKLDFQQD